MEDIQLLIIEDDGTQIQSYEDIIAQYNKKNTLKFSYKISRSFEEGLEALKSPFFDAAIIDLKLSASEDLEGKALVEAVYQKIRIPIIVYSGSLSQIDDIQETALLMKRMRTEEFSSILAEVVAVYNTGITRFLRPDGSVDQKLTAIFWSHLSQDLGTWINHNNQDTLLRYILSHFQEYLDLNVDGDFQEYHPHEVYIRPPIKKHLHTGDLIYYNSDYYLVLTPACDIAIQGYEQDPSGLKIPIRKLENLILVKVKDFDFEKLCLDKRGIVDKSKIKSYVNNSSYRYHYLPPAINSSGFLIDFQDITSMKFQNNLERIATISSPFIKDVISRFSAYYARQGQPTYRQDAIVDELFNSRRLATADKPLVSIYKSSTFSKPSRSS